MLKAVVREPESGLDLVCDTSGRKTRPLESVNARRSWCGATRRTGVSMSDGWYDILLDLPKDPPHRRVHLYCSSIHPEGTLDHVFSYDARFLPFEERRCEARGTGRHQTDSFAVHEIVRSAKDAQFRGCLIGKPRLAASEPDFDAVLGCALSGWRKASTVYGIDTARPSAVTDEIVSWFRSSVV